MLSASNTAPLWADSLVLDLAKTHARMMLDLQRDLAERPMRALWRSSQTAQGPSQSHYNHEPPGASSASGRVLAPTSAGLPRRSCENAIFRSDYVNRAAAYAAIREVLDAPSQCGLLRIYANTYPFGADALAHNDSSEPDEITVCLFAHPHWDADWGGETVLLDDAGEVRRAVVPRPGRLVAFRASIQHAARPVARAATPSTRQPSMPLPRVPPESLPQCSGLQLPRPLTRDTARPHSPTI